MELWHGDCLELMGGLSDGSVDLVLTDPPYGILRTYGERDDCHTMRNGDRLGIKANAYVGWDVPPDMGEVFRAFARVLRFGGQAVVFSMEPLTSSLRTMPMPGGLRFARPMYWKKNRAAAFQNANRSPLSIVEDISLFTRSAAHFDVHSAAHEYFIRMHEWIGESVARVNAGCGFRRNVLAHVFTRGVQFAFPAEATYRRLVEAYHVDEMPGFLPYEVLRTMQARRPDNRTFNLPDGCRSVTNLFDWPVVRGGIHPTQKPVGLMAKLVEIFSREGDTVLDPFAGSGSTGEACMALGRRFIGIEKNDIFFDGMRRRLAGPIQRRISKW